jgi:lipopolysaccharide/colanic/teichoic acid biosynthesis glycosyltransferase
MYGENSYILKTKGKSSSRISLVTKRAFDIFVSISGLLILLPFFSLIALAIKRDSPGPVFFRGKRVGKDGKHFWIYKFRTMYENPESYRGPRVTAKDDPRVTRLGGWLRQTKLNELPQLWNVLKGEMSLVGPRPEDPTLAKTWPVGAREEILSVRPGITSPASVIYHDEETRLHYRDILERYLKDLTPDKMRLDQLYIRYRSFLLDLDILLWTIMIVIPLISSYSPPENFLFVGPITRLIQRYVNWFWLDMLVTFFSISLTGIVWRMFGPLDIGLLKASLFALGFSILFSLISAIWGSNHIQWNKALDSDILIIFPPWVVATISALLLNHMFITFPIGLILIASLLALGGYIIVRFHQRLFAGISKHLALLLEKTQAARERVLIVGSGRTAEHIAWILTHPSYSRRFRIMGFIDDNLFSHGMRIYGSKVIGTLRDLPAILKKLDVGMIILADHRLSYQEFVELTGVQDSRITHVTVVPDLYGSMNFLYESAAALEDTNEFITTLTELPCAQCVIRKSVANANHHSEEPAHVENEEQIL